MNIRNINHLTRAKVSYINGQLSVSLNLNGDDKWAKCATLDNVNLPSSAFVGFGSTTGAVSDNHEIIYVSTQEIENPDGPKAQDSESSSSSEAGFFTYLFYFIVIGGIVGGMYYYLRIQKNSAKSF
jgi:mannose-binding lectin 2